MPSRLDVARDGGDHAAEGFWDEWAGEEVPFLAAQRPWERADAIVLGAPAPGLPSDSVYVGHPAAVTEIG